MNQRFALPLLVAASAIGIAAPSLAQDVPQSHKIVSSSQVIHPVVKGDIVLKDALMNIFAIEDDGLVYSDDGTLIGRIDPDGSIYSGDGEYIGRIDSDGSVYSGDGEYIGRIDLDGSIYSGDGAFVSDEGMGAALIYFFF